MEPLPPVLVFLQGNFGSQEDLIIAAHLSLCFNPAFSGRKLLFLIFVGLTPVSPAQLILNSWKGTEVWSITASKTPKVRTCLDRGAEGSMTCLEIEWTRAKVTRGQGYGIGKVHSMHVAVVNMCVLFREQWRDESCAYGYGPGKRWSGLNQGSSSRNRNEETPNVLLE